MPRYIDADLMIADIQRYLCAYCSIHCNPTSFKNSACDIAECLRMIDNEPTVEAEPDKGWISVKDKMPEFNQKVIVVYNDVDPTGVPIRRLVIAELAVDGYWMEGCTWHPDTSITHWQPLPEPPKGE